jgi:hypothetical protein
MHSQGPVPALILLSVLVLSTSCGPGQVTYQDRVRPLPPDRAHPLLKELLPLLENPEQRKADDLIRTWKDFVGDAPLPLRLETATTFVYYDFTHRLEQVSMEASFAPGRHELLTRFGSTALFYRVYEMPRTDKLQYRFTDGSRPLVDPFRADVIPGGDQWHAPVDPTKPIVLAVPGVSESGLEGQDVTVVLPSSYRRNLGWTYPLLVLVGTDGEEWTATVDRMSQDKTVAPVVVLAVPAPKGTPWVAADLKPVLENQVLPWARSHLRVSPLPADLVLAAWGLSGAAVKDLAVSRPDFWTKTAAIPDGGFAAFLKSQYPVVAP